jgi:recombination protein RecT
MSTENQLQEQRKPLTIQSLMARTDVRTKFEEMLGKKAQGFITSVLQITTSNKLLANADPMSIYNSAAMAATLDLPLNNNLGFAYIVPYNAKQSDGSYKQVAQFQMGYKGFIQLAQRSGQFKTISAAPIYEGQLIESNPLTGFVFDFTKKTSENIIGFAGYFSLINGFEKTLFMTIEEMKAHGLKFSKTYKSGLWQTDFIGMGSKTVIKLLLSKFGPMSIEMQTATIIDQAVINDDKAESITYADHEEITIDKEAERTLLMINDCKNVAELEQLQSANPDIDITLINNRKEELNASK